ncbi:hypothetical protein ACQ86N_01835 [Puia sp. P3]|uniref:hypothetical protein n=1 Tax=Puia sp. P3 TaxID=3423952 RepID=UPI003D67A318
MRRIYVMKTEDQLTVKEIASQLQHQRADRQEPAAHRRTADRQDPEAGTAVLFVDRGSRDLVPWFTWFMPPYR